MNLTVVSMLLGKAQRAGEYNDVTMMLWVQRTYHCVQHKSMRSAHAAEALPFPLDRAAARADMVAVLHTDIVRCCAQANMMLTRYTSQLRAKLCIPKELARHGFKQHAMWDYRHTPDHYKPKRKKMA